MVMLVVISTVSTSHQPMVVSLLLSARDKGNSLDLFRWLWEVSASSLICYGDLAMNLGILGANNVGNIVKAKTS
jgi:hypothetical protein